MPACGSDRSRDIVTVAFLVEAAHGGDGGRDRVIVGAGLEQAATIAKSRSLRSSARSMSRSIHPLRPSSSLPPVWFRPSVRAAPAGIGVTAALDVERRITKAARLPALAAASLRQCPRCHDGDMDVVDRPVNAWPCPAILDSS